MNDGEDRTTQELYGWMAREGSLIWETKPTGENSKEIDYVQQSLIRKLARIDAFMDEVIASKLPAFRMKRENAGKEELERLPLSRYFGDVAQFSMLYPPPHYECSCRVQLFFYCLNTLGLINIEGFRRPRGESSQTGKEPYELFNDLVFSIRSALKMPGYKRRVYEREISATRNSLNAVKYINALYKDNLGLLNLRFEFFYVETMAKCVTATQAKHDLDHLLNNKRSKSTLFAGCVGHLWILHHGVEKGWHFHLIFFFSPEVAHTDSARALEIGRYWNETITLGNGRFYHSKENPGDDMGSGLPHYGDPAQRRLLLKDIGNLIQSEQYLRHATLERERSFGKGERKRVKR